MQTWSTSMTSSSIGSRVMSFSFLYLEHTPVSNKPLCQTIANCEVAYSTRGRLIDSSNPSRLIVSINTPICNSPRPPTSYASRASLCFTVIATFLSASFISLSPSMHGKVRQRDERARNGDGTALLTCGW